MMKLYRKGLHLALIWSCIVYLTSCSSIVTNNPTELLQQSITGLSGVDHYVFEGSTTIKNGNVLINQSDTFTGYVQNHNKLYVQQSERQAGEVLAQAVFNKLDGQWKSVEGMDQQVLTQFDAWNPLDKLEQIASLKQQVSIESSLSNRQYTVLLIEADPDVIRESIISNMKQQAEASSAQAKLKQWKGQLQLDDSKLDLLKKELEGKTGDYIKRMDELSRQLTAEGSYLLYVNRISGLPEQLQMKTTMKYKVDGKAQKEQVIANYLFKDYNKSYLIHDTMNNGFTIQ